VERRESPAKLEDSLEDITMKRTKLLGLACASTLLLSIGIAIAGDPPDVKEGLWSIHTQSTDNPGNVKSDGNTKICRSHAYDAHVKEEAKNMKGCTKANESFTGNKYSVEMHCTVGATTIDSKGTTTFDGDSATHSENHATYTPAMAGISETTMIQDQKYRGACPAGMEPGDLTAADGHVNHLWKH